jgi:hypothetical protein
MEHLLRPAAFLSALVPIFWLAAVLCYAARGRVTLEAAKISFCAGILSLVGGVFGGAILLIFDIGRDAFADVVASAFLTAAFPEELARLLVLVTIVYRHEDIRNGLDRTITAGWAGLGFAAAENVFYVMSDTQWQAVAAVRMATAVPSHVLAGLIMGACLARGFQRPARRVWFAAALIVPVVLHGVYDMCVFGSASSNPYPARGWWGLGLGIVVIIEAVIVLIIASQGRRDGLAPWPRRVWAIRTYTSFLIFTVSLAVTMGSVGLHSVLVEESPVMMAYAGASTAWILFLFWAWRGRPGWVQRKFANLTLRTQAPI